MNAAAGGPGIVLSDNSVVPMVPSVVTGTADIASPIGPGGSLINIPTFVVTQYCVAREVPPFTTETGTDITCFNPAIGVVEAQVTRTTTVQGQFQSTTTTTSTLTGTTLSYP